MDNNLIMPGSAQNRHHQSEPIFQRGPNYNGEVPINEEPPHKFKMIATKNDVDIEIQGGRVGSQTQKLITKATSHLKGNCLVPCMDTKTARIATGFCCFTYLLCVVLVFFLMKDQLGKVEEHKGGGGATNQTSTLTPFDSSFLSKL